MHTNLGLESPRGRRFGLVMAALFAMVGLGTGEARADAVDEIGKKLVGFQAEVRELGSGIQRPDRMVQEDSDRASRKLIDAQVAFGIGDYDNAALMLYDFVEKHKTHRSFDEGLYYLAESLFQKGDYVASRSFFTRLVTEAGTRSKFYQQGLERLIELSLKLRDADKVQEWLAAIERVPAEKRRASVPYVQGKYAFFQDKFDQALAYFSKVPKSSEYYFQARYFGGAAQVSKGNLRRATEIYLDLTQTQPKSDHDKRIVELAYMALGRLHYERDQPSKAIDFYLQIDRRSDLFADALYEVAWVYVKAKQFEKALRALELLALSDPTSVRMPEVKILEGNLRIRRAQRIVEAGTEGNSVEEYAEAIKVFQGLERTFRMPYEELGRLIEEASTAEAFMAQITGRHGAAFDVQATLPEVAAGWIREEPDVQRVVVIEGDLEQIQKEIADAEQTIDRLERALSTESRVNIFPALAGKKTRATEILEELFSLRQQLATHERALVGRHASAAERAELERLQQRRQGIAQQLAALPNANLQYGERIQAARNRFDELDQRAAEVSTLIDSTNATLVALQKYLTDMGAKELEDEAVKTARAEIALLEGEIAAMHAELAEVRREALLAKDAAGTGDEIARREEVLRDQLRQALDDEHRYSVKIVQRLGGKDRSKGDQIASLTRTANSVTVELDRINGAINEVVDYALEDVRADLREEKARLMAYKQEFHLYDGESRQLGGVIIANSFRGVRDKFYDVLVRSDVGVIDVTWSQREGAEKAARTLELDLNRELQTLHADFRDIIEEERKARSAQQKEGGQ